MRERDLDALLVTNLVNVRYLTGFTGSNALCLVGPGLRLFFTDFRYVTQARREVGDAFDREQGRQDLLEDVAERMSGRVAFEDAHLTVRQHERLRGYAGDDVELVAAGRLVEDLRKVKDDSELERIRAAAALADEIFEHARAMGLAGRTERDVAVELETEMRRRGSDPSFPSIVAGGPNGSLPHARPGGDAIEPGTLVVIDMGCVLDGYCSDCTRTFATGPIPDGAAEVYDLVLRTQVATLDEIRPGVACRDVDAFARQLIAAAGHGERFGHGLGHGVGLEVHEQPTLSRAGEGELAAGNVVTVEPGVYVPDEFGVRIEDLVVVSESGREVLSGFPKELTTVG
ncbi:MAG: Xaa-Pro aminopeptidase [Thermoleophilaceae bacterium]|nr:Xaa-Pro aminopeptidase [Thermoleophilaceae bacterium]